MTTMNVLDSAGGTVAIEKPLAPGRSAAATSRPVALSTEDAAALAAVATETTAAAVLAKLIAAPATEAKQDSAITQETAINTVLGLKADATWDGSAAASGVSIWRYLGVKIEAVRALLAGTLTVASHAVTNAGTFAVQAALGTTQNTNLANIDSQTSRLTSSATNIAPGTALATTSLVVGTPLQGNPAYLYGWARGCVAGRQRRTPYRQRRRRRRRWRCCHAVRHMDRAARQYRQHHALARQCQQRQREF